MPKVSVIIPTYNRCKYLNFAIQSVLHQTYANWELLVIDDGSSDDTSSVIQEYIGKDKRIRSFRLKNGGVARARSVGIKEAKGEYVAFLDDDDYYLPHKLELQVNYLEKNPQHIFVYGQADYVDSQGNYIKTVPGNPVRTYGELIQESVIFPTTIMVRRSAFEEFGYFRSSLKTCEDYDMWLRIARKYPFAFISEPVAKYRRHRNNVTHRIHQVYSDENRVRKYLLQAAGSETERVLIRKAIKMSAERFYGMASQYMKTKDYEAALPFYLSAIWINPLVAFQVSWLQKKSSVSKFFHPYIAFAYCVLMVILGRGGMKADVGHA